MISLTFIINVLYIINLLLVSYLVFKKNSATEQTWAWILVLLFVPFVGIILYILFGRGLGSYKIYSTKVQYDLKEKLNIQRKNLQKN